MRTKAKLLTYNSFEFKTCKKDSRQQPTSFFPFISRISHATVCQKVPVYTGKNVVVPKDFFHISNQINWMLVIQPLKSEKALVSNSKGLDCRSGNIYLQKG